VAPAGHVGAEAGLDVSIPTGTIVDTLNAGKTLARAARTRTLSQDEQVQLFGAGTNLALNPPFLVEHVAISYTPFQHWELALRYASGGWRLGVRRQLLTQAQDGIDLTIGIGGQRFAYSFPVDNVLDVLKLDDYVRWNVDVPITLGKHGDFYRLWCGPRLVFSHFSTQMVLDLPPVNGPSQERQLASVNGSGIYLGAQGGAALGYKHLFVGFELTVVRMLGGATLRAFDRQIDVDMGTWVVYPGLALMGEF
jgi:hypothetical protein